MTASISSFNPTTYLSQLHGNKPLTAVANVAPVKAVTPPVSDPASSSSGSGSSGATTTPPATKPANSLLGLSSDVLSALQGSQPTSTNGSTISRLFGSNAASADPLYSSLLTSATSTQPTQQAVQATQSQTAQNTANSSSIQNLIKSYNATQNSNNAALVANAQAVLKSYTA